MIDILQGSSLEALLSVLVKVILIGNRLRNIKGKLGSDGPNSIPVQR